MNESSTDAAAIRRELGGQFMVALVLSGRREDYEEWMHSAVDSRRSLAREAVRMADALIEALEESER